MMMIRIRVRVRTAPPYRVRISGQLFVLAGPAALSYEVSPPKFCDIFAI